MGFSAGQRIGSDDVLGSEQGEHWQVTLIVSYSEA